jgi:hypothetical protein
MKSLQARDAVAACAGVLLGLSAPSPSWSAQCVKQSPAHTVALVELYTSEGCNSCPPADQWLSRIARNSHSEDVVIPLSLHVDYWDRLGWADRFADPRFGERQRELVRWSGSRTIYTPGVFLNQREFRDWSSGPQFRDAIQQINKRPAAADIRLQLVHAAPAQLTLNAKFSIRPGAAAGHAQAFVALFEHRLETDVKAGENRGVLLHHDSVVRAWVGPVEVGRDGTTYTAPLPIDGGWNAKNLGIAAFVQEPRAGQVLQATAMSVCS